MRSRRFVASLVCFLFVSSLFSLSAFAGELTFDFILILNENTTYDKPSVIINNALIDTLDYTLTAPVSTAIEVRSTGKLYLKGNKVVSQSAAGIEVDTGGVLFIQDPVSVVGSTYALVVSSGAEVHLSGGTFKGKAIAAIQVADGDFGALLEKGYSYFDDSGNPIPLSDVGTAKTVVVKQSADHVDHIWEETERIPSDCSINGSIKYTCSECGETKTEELPLSSEHTWIEIERIEPTLTSEGSITYKCSVCGTIKSENIPKLDECTHTWVESERKEPTSTSLGFIKYICSQCGEIKIETIPMLPSRPDPDSVSLINWLGSVTGLFNMTVNSIMSFPALRFFAGVAVFLTMFGLLAQLLKQGRKGRL